jgi:hypothetical protein
MRLIIETHLDKNDPTKAMSEEDHWALAHFLALCDQILHKPLCNGVDVRLRARRA